MGRQITWRGECKIVVEKPQLQPQIDYTSQLTALIGLGNQILTEVSNYNSQVAVDLSPVLTDLSRVIESLNRLPDIISMSAVGVSSSIARLQSEFITIVQAIEGFASTQMLIFQALGDGISATITNESNQVESLMVQFLASQEGQEMDDYSYTHLVGEGGCILSIPAGMSSISFIPFDCLPYFVNDRLQNSNTEMHVSYSGADFARDYTLELPSGMTFSLICNYQKRRNIPPVEITGNVLPFVPKAHRGARSDADDLALAQLADEAEELAGITHNTSVS